MRWRGGPWTGRVADVEGQESSADSDSDDLPLARLLEDKEMGMAYCECSHIYTRE